MPSLDDLPLELLQIIASDLIQIDLSALVQTNRRLYHSLTSCLYQYNKEHFGGSALTWGVRQRIMRTVQYAIQENFDLDKPDQFTDFVYEHQFLDGFPLAEGPTPLQIAIRNGDYAMVRLLVDNGAEINKHHLVCASKRSCRVLMEAKAYHSSTEKFKDDYEHPVSKAFKAALQLGHDELVGLVSRKDQKDIPNLYRPIWPLLVRSVRLCKASMSIILYLLDKGAEKGPGFLFPIREAFHALCDMGLRFLWERKSLSVPHEGLVRPSCVYCAYKAASYGNNSLLSIFLKMGANPDDEVDLGGYNETSLMGALYTGRFETVKLLLQNGANASFEQCTAVRIAKSKVKTTFKKDYWWLQDREEKRKIVEYLLDLGFPAKCKHCKQSRRCQGIWKPVLANHMQVT